MTRASTPKVMVAIHGVGDQLTNETIRTVAARIGTYYGRQGAMPLGSFNLLQVTGAPEILPHGVPEDLGFAEVYWAGIARGVVTGGYVLEDCRKWAKTIVGRVQANADGNELSHTDCLLVENVLEEMIDTVGVLDRLCSLAAKAGIFKFNLQGILDNVVNDVQIVADFPTYRSRILGAFHEVLASVVTKHPTADIYLVAHSEGTVVMLAGLLSAIAHPEGRAEDRPGDRPEHRPEHRVWLDQVRGIMTIGSPLDTHMLLWPTLWDPPVPGADRWTPSRAIPWHNYYDRGDPIGDSLRSTRQWLDRHCPGVFEVTVDHGFSRFYFPGKAHIDYWEDEHVFGHFIEEVTGLPAEARKPAVAAANDAPSPPRTSVSSDPPQRRFREKPPTKWSAQLTSYVVPYGVIALLFFTAVFILYRTVTGVLGKDPEGADMLRDVAILAFLLAGITVAVRIPRLTAMWRWRAVGAAVFVLAGAVYVWPILTYPAGVAPRAMQRMIGEVFAKLGVPPSMQEWTLLVAATLVVVICAVLGRTKRNRWGVRLLLMVGGLLVLTIVGGLVFDSKRPAVWPVVVSALPFFYLWWLAALLFDLVFVWHRYIRHSVALGDLRVMKPTGR